MARLCLLLAGSAPVAERLPDVLPGAAGDEGFTSVPTFGHGAAQQSLGAADQVRGRSAAVQGQVQIVPRGPAPEALLQRLRTGLRGAGLRDRALGLAPEGAIE